MNRIMFSGKHGSGSWPSSGSVRRSSHICSLHCGQQGNILQRCGGGHLSQGYFLCQHLFLIIWVQLGFHEAPLRIRVTATNGATRCGASRFPPLSSCFTTNKFSSALRASFIIEFLTIFSFSTWREWASHF